MNREILFRGKSKDEGVWVTGHYTKTILSNGELVTEIRTLPYEGVLQEFITVDPDTVGQYTGIDDKNGVKIFGGDILKDIGEDLCHIFYNSECCAYYAKYIQGSSALKRRGYWRLGDQCSLTIEVVGNIYDNPELLEAAQ